MKSLTILISIFAVMFVTTSLSANENKTPGVEKRIVKTIMTSNDGKMMIDSTFINEDGKVSVRVDSFMIHPRGSEGNGEFRHIRRERMIARNNEMGEEHEMTLEVSGDSTHTMIMERPNCCKHGKMKYGEGNMPGCKKRMKMSENNEMPCPPMPPLPPMPGNINNQSNMMIDLSDPAIIRYEKKVQKDGTEKITIIRRLQ